MEYTDEEITIQHLELEILTLQIKLADAEALAEHWEQMYYEEIA